MSQSKLPNRIWNIDAKELESMGFDSGSIRAHAMAELGEELYMARKLYEASMQEELVALEKLIKDRHHAIWGVYSAV